MVAGCASVGREGGEIGQNLVGGRRAKVLYSSTSFVVRSRSSVIHHQLQIRNVNL